MAWDDDDDWVGEPPEGHHTRDRAKPEFWRDKAPVSFVAVGIFVVVVVLVIVALLS
jgi:hypothetical protein